MLVPESVSSVTAINIPQLMEKADFEAVRQMGFYREIVEDIAKNNPAFAKVLDDPASAGVDLTQKAYMALSIKKEGVDQETAVFLFSIADKARFEQTLDNLELRVAPTGSGKGFFEHEQTALVWNDHTGIFAAGGDAKNVAESWLETPAKNGIAQNKSLRKTLSKDYDIANWITSDMLSKIYPDLTEGLKKYTPEDFEGNYVSSFLYFEDDRIRGEAVVDLKKNLANDLNIFFRDKVKTDFSGLVPAENQVFMLTAAFDLHGINQVLLERYVQGAAQQPLQAFGLKIEDIADSFSGDMAFTLYRKDDTLATLRPLVLASVKDQKKFDQLLAKTTKKGAWIKTGENRYTLEQPEQKNEADSVIAVRQTKGQLLIKGNICYFAEDGALLDAIQAGGFQSQGPVTDKIKNLQAENIVSAFLLPGQYLFDNDGEIPFTGMQFTAKRSLLEGIADLPAGEGNSLFQLFQHLEKTYQKEKTSRPPQVETPEM